LASIHGIVEIGLDSLKAEQICTLASHDVEHVVKEAARPMDEGMLDFFFSKSAPSILHGAGGPNVRVAVRSWEENTQAVGHGLPFPDTVKYPTQCKKLCHADTEPAALRLQASLKVALAKFVTSRCKALTKSPSRGSYLHVRQSMDPTPKTFQVKHDLSP
jgi:hypothetical protein